MSHPNLISLTVMFHFALLINHEHYQKKLSIHRIQYLTLC